MILLKKPTDHTKDQDLITSELRYRRLFETAQDGILLIDFETGMILDANKFLIDLLGYSKADFLEKHLWEVGVFKDVAASKENFETLQKKRYVRFEDLPLETKAGKTIEVEFVANAYSVGDSTIIQCNIRDISERVSTAEARRLNAVQLQYRQLFEKMSSCVVIYEAKDGGRDFIIKNINKAAEGVEHVKGEDVVGKSVRKVFPGIVKFGLFKVFQSVWRTGKPETLPISFYQDNRISGWKENYVYKLPSNEIVAVYDDVTEQKKAELAAKEELLFSEEKFSKVFQSSPYAITITRTEDGKFMDVNDAFTTITGYSREEAIRSSSIALKLWVNKEDRQKVLDDLKAGKITTTQEFLFRRKNGEVITGLFSTQIVRFKQGPFLLSTIADVSELKQSKLELTQLTRALKMFNESNQALIYSTNENKLLEDVCQIIVNEGGYRLAWVGFVEHDEGKSIRPVVHVGVDSGYIKSVNITWADTELGRGPTGTAVRTKQPSVARNIAKDSKMTPWKENAIKHGYKSSIALPLISENNVFGVLNVYSKEVDAFSEKEFKILKELSADLAFGITTLRSRAEHKRTEDALQISENKFKSFFNNSPEIMLVADYEGNILEVNNIAIRRYGYSRSEFLKMKINELDAPDIPTELKKSIRKIEERGYMSFERIHLKKNKAKVPVEISSTPIDYNGQKAIFAIVKDITGRKQAEENLKASEIKYSTLVESGNDGIIVIQHDGALVYVNSIICKLTGYTRAETIGKPFLGYITPEYREIEAERFKRRIMGQKAQNRYEIDILSKDEVKTPVEINASSIIYDGKPAVMAIVRDITERKKAEQLINEAKTKDEAILGSIGDAVFACGKDGKLLLFNKMAEEMTGITAKEAIGKQYSEIINFVRESDGKLSNDFIAEAIKKNKTTKMANHVMLVREDGQRIPVADSAAPIRDINNEIIGCVVVFHDVTKERQIDKIKTEFVSLASHQLRTPLTMIKWYVEMLLSEDNGKLEIKQQEYAREIDHASQRMVNLVNALLNVARLETGTFTVEPRLINIINIAKTSLKELNPLITNKKLIVKQKFDHGVSSLRVDPKLMAILFQNLLSNSVKYTKKGGKVELLITKEDKHILIKVSDNGIGIPKSQQKQIFEKLFRADNAKEIDPDGAGLGLYIVKEITDNAGGKVWFESQEGKGTTFYLTLPISGMLKKEGSRQLI